MKNQVYDCEVVTERVVDGKIFSGTIVPRYEVRAVDVVEAREIVLMQHGAAIIEAKQTDEVEIIVRPFCSE